MSLFAEFVAKNRIFRRVNLRAGFFVPRGMSGGDQHHVDYAWQFRKKHVASILANGCGRRFEKRTALVSLSNLR